MHKSDFKLVHLVGLIIQKNVKYLVVTITCRKVILN